MSGTRLLWRIARREMWRHPGRTLLTLMSVVIGVAAVLAVGLSIGSARQAYQQMYEAITGRASLEVRSIGNEAFSATLLDEVRQTPGVQAAVPLIQRNAILYYDGGRMSLQALGIEPSQDSAVRDYELVDGYFFWEGKGLLLDASLALRNLKISVGDPVRLLVRRGLLKTKVVGLLRPRSGSSVSSGGVLFMPLAEAQRRFAASERLDRIQIVLADDADSDTVQSELARRLPATVRVQPPATRSALAEETMLALENGLRLATAFSLLAAVFIIINTFLMNVGQRRRQLSVMRAMGATRQQIIRLLVCEALLMALAGTGVGILCGLAGASLLNVALSDLFSTPLPPIQARAGPVLIAVAIGLGISLLGAALPARKAAQLSPAEGLSGVARQDIESRSWRSGLAGLALIAVAAGMFAACMVGWLPFEVSVTVTVLALVSLVLFLPLMLRPLTYVVAWALRPLAAVESRLARRQLLRHRGRTSLTIGVLFIAVSTGLGLANSVMDNVEDVRQWYRTTIVGDFFVRAAMPDMKTGLSAAVPDVVGREIENIDGIAQIRSVRFVAATAHEERVIIIVIGDVAGPVPEVREPAPFYPPSGDEVLIGSVLAHRLGLQTGDTISLDTGEGQQALPIAAVVNDYAAGGLTIHMNRPLAQRLLNVEGVDAFVVKADHGALSDVQSSLGSLCVEHGMLLQSYVDLTQAIEVMMAGVVSSLWGLLVLGLIVAAFGVVNTLGMNVLEQTREFGLLRVVAMTRGQVRKAIICQACMLGLIGVVPGLLGGLAMAYIMHLATLPVTGHPVAFRLHPELLLGGFAAAMVAVLVAAWIPAERAARLELAAALRYE